MAATIINVVSGKGGTGKTLLSAILGRTLASEGLKVLLIDFDVFVRGLTILLYRSLAGNVLRVGSTVSDLFRISRDTDRVFSPDDLQVRRFLDFDFIPATTDVSEPLSYEDLERLSNPDLQRMIEILLGPLASKYDIIFIDNRAGIDRIVISVCEKSDIILSVAEDDEVALQANSNLVNHLRYKSNFQNIFTIINKARRIDDVKDLEKKKERQPDLSYIGIIPFDRDVLNWYGTADLWSSANQTLYFFALVDTWNTLARQAGVKAIELKRYPRPPRLISSSGQGTLLTIERMAVLYGLLGLLGSGAYYIYITRFLSVQELYVVVTAVGSLGLITSVYTGALRKLFARGPSPPQTRD